MSRFLRPSRNLDEEVTHSILRFSVPIPTGSKVYVDTNVWVYYLINPRDPMLRHCTPFLQEIEAGRLKGVVTTFVVCEVIGVAKKLLAEARDQEPSPADAQALEARMEHELGRLGIEEHDADLLASSNPIFGRSHQILLDSGVVRIRLKKWKPTNAGDAIHLSLAERVGADYFATCDKGLRKSASSVKPVILEDEYP